jgi:hypothetical protein
MNPPHAGARPHRALPWRAGLAGCRRVLLHSLFPIVALALIAGSVLWGPWGTLVLALAWWNIVTRTA